MSSCNNYTRFIKLLFSVVFCNVQLFHFNVFAVKSVLYLQRNNKQNGSSRSANKTIINLNVPRSGYCPEWGQWQETTQCVMPMDLQGAVAKQCPRLSNEGDDEKVAKNRLKRGDLFSYGPPLMLGGYETSDYRDILGPALGSIANEIFLGQTGFFQQKPDKQENSARPATAAVVINGRPDYSGKPLTQEVSKQLTIWEQIYTHCGSCAVQVRCRTRKAHFACSPTIEVERAPCNQTIEALPACQLPSVACKVLGNIVSGRHPPGGGVLEHRRVPRAPWGRRRGPSMGWGGNRGISANTHQRRWTKMPRWHQVGRFSKLNTGFSGNSGFPAAAQQTKFVHPSKQPRSAAELKGYFENTPLPELHCVFSGKGCLCCCDPFYPTNGLCKEPLESFSGPGSSTTILPMSSTSSSYTMSQHPEHIHPETTTTVRYTTEETVSTITTKTTKIIITTIVDTTSPSVILSTVIPEIHPSKLVHQAALKPVVPFTDNNNENIQFQPIKTNVSIAATSSRPISTAAEHHHVIIQELTPINHIAAASTNDNGNANKENEDEPEEGDENGDYEEAAGEEK